MRIFTCLFILLILFPVTVKSAEYHIEPGDVLVITVYEQPDLTTKVRVTTKGEISFPLLGTISVTGLTVNELERKLTELLEKDYLVNPQVNIFIEEYHPRKVFVIGAVNKAGEYELFKERTTTVLMAIAMAGGFKEGAAQNNTKIIRSEGSGEEMILVKVTDITKKGDKSKDVPVEPGDIVVVPESFLKVFVIGAVNRPGEYGLFEERSTTVLEAIAMAGGFKEGAAKNNTKIIRLEGSKENTIPIRVTDITEKGDKSKDIPVEPGDIIVVPESFF